MNSIQIVITTNKTFHFWLTIVIERDIIRL